jgi:hypothetical protein
MTAANDFLELPISARHGLAAGKLPRHHDDPFDRMLIAQAQLEDLVLVTHDSKIEPYGLAILATPMELFDCSRCSAGTIAEVAAIHEISAAPDGAAEARRRQWEVTWTTGEAVTLPRAS